jgi:hypothetical protein
MSDREQKNSIFGQGQGGLQVVDRVKAELGMDIPVDNVPLPSRGKIYPQNSALHGAEEIQIRAMTTREEDILTSQALIKKGTVINTLIKSCIVDPNIDVQELILGDRNALMIAIRITGYGAEYSTEFECPECNHKAPYDFMLDQLAIKPLEIDPVSFGQNLFEYTLPVCKKTVQFKFLTGRDEEEMTVTQQKMKKLQIHTDTLVTTRLQYAIVSVEGKTDKSLINSFIKRMPARDSLVLRKYMEKHEPGIDMRQEYTCPACSYTEEVAIPLGVSFFWPQT